MVFAFSANTPSTRRSIAATGCQRGLSAASPDSFALAMFDIPPEVITTAAAHRAAGTVMPCVVSSVQESAPRCGLRCRAGGLALPLRGALWAASVLRWAVG